MKKIRYHLIVFVIYLIYPLISFANQVHYDDHTAVFKQKCNSDLKNQVVKGSSSKEKVKYKVEVVPYDPNWPKVYEKESSLLGQKLADNTVSIHHVGSTSVPGLNAKPIIDIIAVVKDAPSTIKILESIGYEYIYLRKVMR